ncbi:uncharacterized protein LOC108033853 [Drosophila biarmipes]|uniref:uncharacterized protein LOC108033853 n=1 Tax=Drosophila biarmipes TaxID=125945 RepID=UPI001CDA9EC0|nr:uncharacterized protein LOC108033853 [Drosophila biarmipes]XP_043950024.1 uncharacterized protein LOC108033853 [Drosophila biarmipes]XP_043950025.1 uncharacterized protein LOC108033853 [Drosophila biarmipes]
MTPATAIPTLVNVVVGKNEMVSIRNLLVFINNTLDCELRGMDDLKTGAVYCQIMHRLFPTAMPIHKVKFYTHKQSEFEANFRLLHNCLKKLNVSRFMPVEELIVGRNHVDFCNWMYKFFKFNDNGCEYDAKKVRKDSPIGLSRSLEIAAFSTGNLSAMYKCQSMNFNYAKDPFRLTRRHSLDSRRLNSTALEREIKPPTRKTAPPKKTTKANEYLAESRNVSLPPDSEDELEICGNPSYLQRQLTEKLKSEKKNMTGLTYSIEPSNSTTKCLKPQEFTSWKALSEKVVQLTNDLQAKDETIGNLNCEVRCLTTDQLMLAGKVRSVEQTLINYGNNPVCAVQQLKEILFNSSQVAAVRPRTRPGGANHEDQPSCSNYQSARERPAKQTMPPRHSRELKPCIEFSPKEGGVLETKELNSLESLHEDAVESHRGYPRSCDGFCTCHCCQPRERCEHREKQCCRRHRRSSVGSLSRDQDHKHRHEVCSSRTRSPECKHRHHSRDGHHRHRHHSEDSEQDRRHLGYKQPCGKHCKHTKAMRVCISNWKKNDDSDSTSSTVGDTNCSKLLNQNNA